MEQFTIVIDNAKDWRFKGKKVAETIGRVDDPVLGNVLKVYTIYKTTAGTILGHKQTVVPETAKLIREGLNSGGFDVLITNFFGQDELAKELYFRANIDNTEWIP